MKDARSTRRQSWLRKIVLGVTVTLLAASCGGSSGEGPAPTTSSTVAVSTTTTTTAAPVTTTTAPVSTTTSTTTMPPASEPPVIELDGYTTVYSRDGQLRVSGWLDRSAAVTVGDVSAEVYDDPYGGVSTFETFLELEPGQYGIPIKATDSHGFASEIYLSVLVDPALEMQLALIEEVDLLDRTVVADYVELLHGDEATVAAREDGEIGENEETPGGFYLRNRNPQLRTLTLGDLRVVTLLASFAQSPYTAGRAVDIETWVALTDEPDMAEKELGGIWYGFGFGPYWLTLQDGVIVQIVEQYLP